MSTAKVTIYRSDGSMEEHEVGKHILMHWIMRMIDAKITDSVNLRDGRIMFVDDTGAVDGKPVNDQATKLYHAICKPGTTWQIRGDVAITLDSHFG